MRENRNEEKNHPIFRKGGLELETKIKLLAAQTELPLMQW